MAISWLTRLAARGPATVFPALGMRGEEAFYRLALDPRIKLVDSPRHASLLLVAGGVPPEMQESLRRIHDQLPAPFATLWYQSEPLLELQQADVARVDSLEALPDALVDAHRKTLCGELGASPRLLPDEPPNPWKGLGDDGHGGEGMMGGVPYGRPMAMPPTDDLRDGLALDILTFRLGPFFPLWPAGLEAEVTLQGDIVQQFAVQSSPFPRVLAPVFFEARERAVSIATLERERARYHLRVLFHALHLAGLEDLALDALRLAETCESAEISALEKRFKVLQGRLKRRGFLALHLPQRGALSKEQAESLGGFAARAAGIDQDARLDDEAYRRLDFSVITQQEGDTRTRWRQRLAEVAQSLRLVELAQKDNVVTANREVLETPRGAGGDELPRDASSLLADLLPGLEWGEALATVASLDLAAVSQWSDEAQEQEGEAA
ncbi:hypothetical protein FGL86_00145 [Pistricoccus aurantiacus]|uniref:NADH-quinone oxidoreductase subunit D domain-containing protein n=1 Tax=Pistricoccus aurantiacus TaxID=1883414 RepID=A0A5B8SR73_9GAMM|nr:hypothetical protein [Pistricoccus aurantiacus]QEA37633.1 hypothetical protein FGL86_00145 [Pistricoccus aurantiacus]